VGFFAVPWSFSATVVAFARVQLGRWYGTPEVLISFRFLRISCVRGWCLDVILFLFLYEILPFRRALRWKIRVVVVCSKIGGISWRATWSALQTNVVCVGFVNTTVNSVSARGPLHKPVRGGRYSRWTNSASCTWPEGWGSNPKCRRRRSRSLRTSTRHGLSSSERPK